MTYVYCLFYLFDYIKDPDQPYTKGIWMCAAYGFACWVATIFRNYYMFMGYMMAIRLRKAIVSAMYDKVAKLSTKSLTETNSGKLITIISGDIFNVERAICILPIFPAAPLITLLCMYYISRNNGWWYSLVTLAVWIGCLIGQAICNHYTKILKAKDAVLSDHRMKLINDLVNGIRTIKSYAWEHHYLKKIKEIRA